MRYLSKNIGLENKRDIFTLEDNSKAQGFDLPINQLKEHSLALIESHIIRLQAALNLAKQDLKTEADTRSLSRKIQVVKALIDELSVMRQIKKEMSISSSIEGQVPNRLP